MGTAILLAAGTLVASAGVKSTVPGPLSATCRQNPVMPSDFLTYTLSVTFPTTGYTMTLTGTRLHGQVVDVAVHYTLAPGLHGDVVTTEKVKFTMIAPKFPKFFTVTANGKLLGGAKVIQPAPRVANPLG